MDWDYFNKCNKKLITILRTMTEEDESPYILDVYSHYNDSVDSIKIIVERIEKESIASTTFNEQIFKMIKNGKPDNEFFENLIKNHIKLTVDIKSFFIFTRIFLDTLAQVVRISFGRKGKQLSPRITELVEDKKHVLSELDSDFTNELTKKMSWMNDFVKKRVELEHYLGGIRSTMTRDGDFGFDILSSRERRSWGTNTVVSITDYIKSTIYNLSEVVLFICKKFNSN